MSHFTAQYSGRCRNCNEVFEAGAEVFYAPGEDTVTVLECCGDAQRTAAAGEMPQVMPRGKTARDACGMCFQVPASNGLCGCAW
jgi:hypothetical protein